MKRHDLTIKLWIDVRRMVRKNSAPNKKGPVAGALCSTNDALADAGEATSFSLQEPSSQQLSSWLRSSSF